MSALILMSAATTGVSADHSTVSVGLVLVVGAAILVFIAIKVVGQLLALALRVAIIAGLIVLAPSLIHTAQGLIARPGAPAGASDGVRQVRAGANQVVRQARAQGLDPAGVRVHIVCGGSMRRLDLSDADARLLGGVLRGQTLAVPLPGIVTC